MSADENLWELLDEQERELLITLQQMGGSITPAALARQLGWSLSKTARVFKPMAQIRVVRRTQYGKQVGYELARDGWRLALDHTGQGE